MASSRNGQRQDRPTFSHQWMGPSTPSTQPTAFGYIPLPPDILTGDPSEHSLNQSSILNNQESQYLGTFLDNTDFFKSMDTGIKQEHEPYETSLAFGDGSTILSNHFGTTQPSGHRSQAHASNYYPLGQNQMAGAYDDSSAAHSLMGLSNPQHSQAAMSWGSFSAPIGLSEASTSFNAPLPTFNASNLRTNTHYDQPTGFPMNQQAYPQDASQHSTQLTQTPLPHYQEPATFFQFGQSASSNPTNNHRTSDLSAIEARFGTDDSFGSTGYRGSVGNSEHEKYASLTSMPLADRAATYNMSGAHVTTQRRKSTYDFASGEERPQSTKRRKTKVEAEDDDDYHQRQSKASETTQKRFQKALKSADSSNTTPSKNGGSRRKSAPNVATARQPSFSGPYDDDSASPDALESESPGDSGDMGSERKHSRARGSDAGAAASRQNLTDAQKRENHIRSEQKRRNIIKQGYNDLNHMVPSLAGGRSGLSKAELLKEVITYIEDTAGGNNVLAHLLPPADRAEMAEVGGSGDPS